MVKKRDRNKKEPKGLVYFDEMTQFSRMNYEELKEYMDKKKQPNIVPLSDEEVRRRINADPKLMARVIVAMSHAMGQAKETAQLHTVEGSEEINSIEKILPEQMFISSGPGPLEGKYYAVLMRPATEKELRKDPEQLFIHLNKMKMGYDTREEALNVASQMLPSVPVLTDPKNNTYEYPSYESFWGKYRIEAHERRKEKNARRQERYTRGRKKL